MLPKEGVGDLFGGGAVRQKAVESGEGVNVASASAQELFDDLRHQHVLGEKFAHAFDTPLWRAAHVQTHTHTNKQTNQPTNQPTNQTTNQTNKQTNKQTKQTNTKTHRASQKWTTKLQACLDSGVIRNEADESENERPEPRHLESAESF